MAERLFAYTRNIGVGGAFILTEDPFPAGTAVRVRFEMPTGRRVELSGEVRWIADGEEDAVHGMGVRFLDLSVDQRLDLNEYFASLTAEGEPAPEAP